MVAVHGYFVGPDYRTEVWISARAENELHKYIRRNKRFGSQLERTIKRYAESGFAQWEEKGILRREGARSWRLGRSDLFRLLGGYGGSKEKFLILDAGRKPGQRRGRLIDERVAEIERTLEACDWVEVANEPTDEANPR